ncbi:MAG: IS607 family transposase [Actinomycetota bacterium]|nr:IS607 family transposase [Actinomycetota bacterium]
MAVVTVRFVGVAEAKSMLGVSSRTLRRYTAEGRLPDRRSPGGRRIFSVTELEAIQRRGRLVRPETSEGAVIVYGRVSSRRQAKEGDLGRQMERLREATAGRMIAGEFSDVASGLSDRRPGLRRALHACLAPEVTEIWITHPERLARFGVGIMEQLLSTHGVQIVAIGEDEALLSSAESELVRDMLSVVTSFSERLHGQRSAKTKALRRSILAETKK